MVVLKANQDIFESECEWLVCPTNTQGPLGAGLAKIFRDRYPGLEHQYKQACKFGTVSQDRFYAWHEGDHRVLCVPTKGHWKDPSTLKIVNLGCLGISQFLKERVQYSTAPVKSIAVPALGCGLGGLSWKEVNPVLHDHARSWARVVDYVEIYSPR